MISRLVDENYKLFVFSLYIDYQCVVFTKCFFGNVKAFTAGCNDIYRLL